MLGFNPPFLVDNLIFANVFGPTAVASAAPFRLADGYPQGLLEGTRVEVSKEHLQLVERGLRSGLGERAYSLKSCPAEDPPSGGLA